MTTQKPSTSSSSSIAEKGWNYDVFMSFRGKDTRKTFSGHLYEALDGKGIHTFIDDEKLERGEEISVELVKAIEESKISIVVLSEEYASSTWCLQELVQILECWKTKGQKVVPIFYKVDPSEVRKQMGSFGRALARHEENGRNVQRWKEALTEVAGLSGYDLRNFADGSEAKLIKHIVGFISTLTRDHTSLFVAEHPVGIDSRVEEVISLLGVGDVGIIGIWGVGGIGKTTIAKGVYNQIFSQFQGATFLPNVRAECSTTPDGLLVLQRTLLSEILGDSTLININNIDRGLGVIQNRLRNKRVLVILDDVEHRKQLEKLVGHPNWFGSGSRIIITTRDEGLLKARYGSNYKTYHVKILNYDEVLELFSWYAFKENHPKSGFLELSKKVVKYAGCLPLALEVLGSFLRERSTDEWISELDKLRRIPNNDIQEILKVSFDGLDRTQKEIFLDVAFFFIGWDINYATKILESIYDFHPAIVLKVLTERSLITKDSDNTLGIHDLVQEMAREIVRQESPEEPGKRSRLSFYNDVDHVLTKNTGTEAVKGIFVHFIMLEEVLFSFKAIERMNALKLLVVTPLVEDNNMPPPEDINYLSNELRYLLWRKYPSTSLPSSFHPTHLVELHLSWSRIEQLWKTKTSTLENLKSLDLSHSPYLTKTPDLSAFPRLEELNLEGCTRLVEVHPSSLVLNRLVCLNLNGCISLRRLWEGIELKSLQHLRLSFCSKLEKLPEIRGTMEHLQEINLYGSGIKELPSSIEHITGLKSLNLTDCENLASLPSSIDKLKSLETLILSGCSKLEKLPEIRGTMEYLREVYLDRSGIKELPSSIEHLTGLRYLILANCKNLASLPSSKDKLISLKTLYLSGCSKLENLPEIRGTMEHLREVNLSGSGIKELPSSIEHLTGLRLLNLAYCKNLASLPSSIDKLISLKTLNLSGCSKLENLLKIRGTMEHLREVNLNGRGIKELPSSIEHLTGLRCLNLANCKNLASLPSSIDKLISLKTLYLSGCSKLENLPKIRGTMEHLREVNLNGSGIKELPSSIKHLTGLHRLNLAYCKNLASLPSSMDKLISLKTLNLSGCSKLENLPKIRGTMEHLREVNLNESGIKQLPSSIEHLTGLHCLNLANCKNLASLPSSIDKLISLKTLNVSGCSKLESLSLQGCKDSCPLSLLLPSLSGLSSLTVLNVSGCNLSDGAIPGISCLSLLRKLNLSRNNFVSPPEGLNRLGRLKFIEFENCPWLRELSLLPTSIEEINAHGCRSLEKLPHPSYLENLDNPRVIFSDCQKLNTVIYLKRMHQVPCKDFEIFFPGSETPEWFEHKSTGSSISFDMSPLEFRKFRGVGLCAVLPLMEMPLDNVVHLMCSLFMTHFMIPPKIYTESDHVWMKFLKREELVNRLVPQVYSDGLYHFEASFEAICTLHLPIKKCGVHIFNWEEEEIKHNIMFDDSDSYSKYSNVEYDNYSEEEEEEEERSGSECSYYYSSSGEE